MEQQPNFTSKRLRRWLEDLFLAEKELLGATVVTRR
jgi:hypothetical protein